MFRALDLAASFFEDQYLSPAGAAARAYVEGRGIGTAVREKFRVGYAPARWDGLSSHLASKKIPVSDLERLGLCAVNERGRYDFFRDRVMLPVIDRQKRVVGFGSRLLDPDAKDRKYVNSPESPLFHKKEQLYGLHAALEAIRKSGSAVVVEGNFDVLALHEAGIEEAVAPMGTALTVEQVAALGRHRQDGHRGVRRRQPPASARRRRRCRCSWTADVDGRVARLPAGFDPDDFVRRSDDGAATFRRMVEGARPMLDQFIQDSVEESSIEGKMATLETGRRAPGPGEEPDQARALRRTAGRRARPDDPAGEARAAGGRDARPPRQPRGAGRRGGGSCRAAAVAAPGAPAAGRAARDRAARPLPGAAAHTRGRPAPASCCCTRRSASCTGWPPRWSPRPASSTCRPGWTPRRPSSARRSPPALMDGSLAEVADPTGLLRKLVTRLELLRLDAEIDMSARLSREAHARGDEAAQRALSIRGMELRKTKEGLQAALQRP